MKDRGLNGRYKQDRHLSDSKMKAPMFPMKHCFILQITTMLAEPFILVETSCFPQWRRRLKLPWMAVFDINKSIPPPHFSQKTFDGKDIALMYWQLHDSLKQKRKKPFYGFFLPWSHAYNHFFIVSYCRSLPSLSIRVIFKLFSDFLLFFGLWK